MLSAEDPAGVLDAIAPYEPIYALLQPNPVEVKFQFSMAIRLVGPPVAPLPLGERRSGLYLGYSQTSIWDIESTSAPFYDTSYRPEAWYHLTLPKGPCTHLGLEGGFGHESNGRDGSLSRSFNHLFLRPVARFDLADGWYLNLHPRARAYVTTLRENPDLPQYRGYFDVEADLGKADSWQLALIGRVGSRSDKGSVQADVTYPLTSLSKGWVHAYAHIQYYHGYGENLRAYDQLINRGTVGLSFVR